MKKQLISIISLLGVLGIVVLAYFIIPEKNNDNTAEATEEKSIQLLNIDSNNIKRVEFVNKENSFTIDKMISQDISVDEETNDISIAEIITWVTEGITDTLDNEQISTSLMTASQLKVDKEFIENVEDLSQYGLDNPSEKMILELSDNSKTEICFGERSVIGDKRYIKLSDSNNVYTLDNSEANKMLLTLTLIRQINWPIRSVKFHEVDNFIIKSEGYEPIKLICRDDNWFIKDPYANEMNADNSKVLEKLAASILMELNEVYHLGSKELSEFGLDNPAIEIIIQDSEGIKNLYFSKAVDGYSYFTFKGHDKVYRVLEEEIKKYFINPYNLIAFNPFKYEVENLNTIEVENNGEKYIWELNSTEVKQEDGVTIETQYKLNGVEKKEAIFEKFYANMKNLILKQELKEEVETGEALIKINITGDIDVTANFYEYNKNKDFYILELNGNKNFLIEKKNVDNSVDITNIK